MKTVRFNNVQSKNIGTGEVTDIPAIKGKDGAEYDDTEIKGEVSHLNAKTIATDKSLDALWKLSKGQVWDIVQEVESGLATPPKGAKYESLIDIRGKNTQVQTNGKNLFDLNDFGNSYEVSGTSLVGRCPVFVGNGTTLTLSTDYQRKEGFTSVFLLENVSDSASSSMGAYKGHPITIISSSDYVYVGLYFNANKNYQTTYQQLIEQGIHIQLEIGDTATVYEPYTGGIPSPNPAYPQEIHSVKQINVSVNGETRTIIPPFYLNGIYDIYDYADIDKGVYRKVFKTITEDDYSHSIERETDYFLLETPTETPINAEDLEFLKSLINMETENTNLIITDQTGNDISYLMEYIIKLSEVN